MLATVQSVTMSGGAVIPQTAGIDVRVLKLFAEVDSGNVSQPKSSPFSFTMTCLGRFFGLARLLALLARVCESWYVSDVVVGVIPFQIEAFCHVAGHSCRTNSISLYLLGNLSARRWIAETCLGRRDSSWTRDS